MRYSYRRWDGSQHLAPFDAEELLEALSDELIADGDLERALRRLFRDGEYPTLRGTLLSLDHHSHVLYTRGGVDFFKTYPGMYVPRPLGFLCHETQQTTRSLSREILGLTKMNWNNTQFDNADPIIVKAARRVGSVLKYVDDEEPVQYRYAYYM